MQSVGFPSCFVGKLSYCPRLYIFRGSITRPAPLFPPASYSRYRVGTWGSLLTCWLGFDQVGLESSLSGLTRSLQLSLRPPDSHPLGNISRFPESTSFPMLRAYLGTSMRLLGVTHQECLLFMIGNTIALTPSYRDASEFLISMLVPLFSNAKLKSLVFEPAKRAFALHSIIQLIRHLCTHH